jgi:hypothetical protein
MLCDLYTPPVTKLLGAQSDAAFASCLDHFNKLLAGPSEPELLHAVERVSILINIIVSQQSYSIPV